jgi:DNA-binding NarL/FixJ family response regulator
MRNGSPHRPRILVIDDHDLIRKGVRRIVEEELGWEVCGEAQDGRSGLALAEELEPDIVILDVVMPGLNGVDAARRLKKLLPKTEVLVFTGNENRETIVRCFDAGARSFLPKTELTLHLRAALRALAQHKPYITPDIAAVVFECMLDKPIGDEETAPGESLSEREREIVQMVAEGHSSKQIAEALCLSVKTVETHRSSVMAKLGFKNLADMVRYAVRSGIIQA